MNSFLTPNRGGLMENDDNASLFAIIREAFLLLPDAELEFLITNDLQSMVV